MTQNHSIWQDWQDGNSQKGKVVLVLFRIAQLAKIHPLLKIALIPYLLFYKLLIEWVLGIELPYDIVVGPNFKLFHGQGLVVNKATILGEGCTIRHNTTIGNLHQAGPVPKIGNNVNIGAHVCILGDIVIGDNVHIGAGAIVVKSIPSNSVVVGNPAKVIKTIEPSISDTIKVNNENSNYN